MQRASPNFNETNFYGSSHQHKPSPVATSILCCVLLTSLALITTLTSDDDQLNKKDLTSLCTAVSPQTPKTSPIVNSKKNLKTNYKLQRNNLLNKIKYRVIFEFLSKYAANFPLNIWLYIKNVQRISCNKRFISNKHVFGSRCAFRQN